MPQDLDETVFLIVGGFGAGKVGVAVVVAGMAGIVFKSPTRRDNARGLRRHEWVSNDGPGAIRLRGEA